MTFFYDLNKRLNALGADKTAQLNEAKGDGNLANNAKPYDKVTRGDVIAGRLGKDEMGGKHKNAKHKFKKTMDEADMEEGNEFAGELAKARASGAEEFKVGDNTYPVKESAGEFTQADWDKVARKKRHLMVLNRNLEPEDAEQMAAERLGYDYEDVVAWIESDQNMAEAVKEIPGGRRHTAEPGGYGRKADDDAPKPVTKKGRGRPRKGSDSETGEVMKPDFSAFGVGGKIKLPKHTGAVTKHKMVGEGEHGDVDAAIAMLKKAGYTVSKNKRELDEKAESENQAIAARIALQHKKAGTEPKAGTASAEMVKMSKTDLKDFTKAKPGAPKKVDEENTDTRDSRAEKAGKKVTRDIEYDERVKDQDHGKKRDPQDARAEKAGKRVAKDIEHDEKVDETTVSGSVAPAAETPKSAKGMSFGKGIYDSWNRELEGMIAESINVSVNMSTNNETGTPSKNITVSADGEDADRLAELLQMAGLGTTTAAKPEVTGGCGAEPMEEQLANSAGNTEYSDDAFQYSGGLNKPKSTGQTTVPVIASQVDRQSTEEEIEETYDPYFDPESRESQKYKEPRDDIDPDSDDPYDDELDEIALMKERAGINEQQLDEGVMDKIKGIVPKFMQMVGADAAANIANRVKQVTGGDYSLTQTNAVNVAKAFGFDRMLGKQMRENAESDQYGLAGNWQGKLLQLIHAGTIGGGIAHLATAGSTSGGGLGAAGIILTVIGGILLLFTETFWSKNRGQVGAMGRYGNQGVETGKGPETKLGEDDIRLMKERAGIADGKYTQDYFTANQPSAERQRAEADREQRPNTPFSRDPIEATTDRAIDRLSQMFKSFKKK